MNSESKILNIDSSKNEIINLSDVDLEEIKVTNSSTCVIDLLELKENQKITLNVEENSNLDIRIISTWKNIKANIIGKVGKNATLNFYLADLNDSASNFSVLVDLNDKNSSSTFKLSSLSNDKKLKKYTISFNHNSENTNSSLEAFGVAKDNSRIMVDGISHILENSNKSSASQSVRVMLFDEQSSSIANPILKIDCNDVKAKHGCAVGSLKDEHLFYLLSRGIDEKEARNILTLGYLMPICRHFNVDDKVKIQDMIGGSL